MAKITKSDAARFLTRVPDEYVFRCADNCVMHDEMELARALASMDDQTYAYHANETKNDFSMWVSDIIGDKDLAASLRRAIDKMQAARYTAERLAFLSKKASQKS